MKIKDIIRHLEQVAPPIYQEGYDNAGLIVGDAQWKCTGVITCLDSTEAVIAEAVTKGCNLVVAHHPIVFKGLKRLTGRTYVERVILEAIRHNVAIYAIHTNLDNVYAQGVNGKIAERLGLQNTRILAPKALLKQVIAYVQPDQLSEVQAQLTEAGASAQSTGNSVRLASVGASPQEEGSAARIRLEVIFPQAQQGAIMQALAHFNELDYSLMSLENKTSLIGSGMVGELPKPMKETDFLALLKQQMKVSCIKHTALRKKKVKRVALCGGAGGFLLRSAVASGADFFITADYKYHEFFDADQQIVIADIGHFESEQFTIDLLCKIIREKFGNFAVHCTEVNTNPVRYYH